MSRQLLVPLDESPQAYSALEFALEQYTDPTITMLYATDPLGLYGDIPIHLMQKLPSDKADEIFDKAQALVTDYDASSTPVAEIGHPSRAIVAYAEKNDVDQIIMGSHGRTGASRVLLGSVAEAVVRRAPTPVTIIRSPAEADDHLLDRVLVPIDDGEPSTAALEYALDMFPNKDITVLHITDPIEGYKPENGPDSEAEAPTGTYLEARIKEADERTESLLDDAEHVAEDQGTEIETVQKSGQPAQEIVAHAETHDFDHLVIGSHGRTSVARVLLGSVAESVVRRAHCPVTVLR